MVVCSSGHISTAFVPGMPASRLQFSTSLGNCAHTHKRVSGRREILPVLRVSAHFAVSRKINLCHSSLAVTFNPPGFDHTPSGEELQS